MVLCSIVWKTCAFKYDWFDAAKYGKASVIKKMLKNPRNFRRRDLSDHTALMIAARNGNTECVRLLLDKVM